MDGSRGAFGGAYQPGQPISVVLTCCNKAACLPHVIGSLARNTIRPDVLVLTDDASSDHSPEIFEQLCAGHGLTGTTILHPANGTPFRVSTLRNDGVAACPDGLVIIMDADHVSARTMLEAHRDLHLRHAGRVLSTGPRFEYAYPDCTGPINFMWGHEAVSRLQPTPDEPLFGLACAGAVLGLTRACFMEIGGFDSAFDGNYGIEDYDFSYRAWKTGCFLAGSFEAHVIHIPHPAYRGRDSSRNRETFQKKHGLKLAQPRILKALQRTIWSEYYQELLNQSRLMGSTNSRLRRLWNRAKRVFTGFKRL